MDAQRIDEKQSKWCNIANLVKTNEIWKTINEITSNYVY